MTCPVCKLKSDVFVHMIRIVDRVGGDGTLYSTVKRGDATGCRICGVWVWDESILGWRLVEDSK